ncbi:MAG: hypothetical protein AB9869_09550 [Verrucomicrobiia bacterium]
MNTHHSSHAFQRRSFGLHSCHLLLLAALNYAAHAAEPVPSRSAEELGVPPPGAPVLTEPASRTRDWSVQFGVAYIAQQDIGDVISGGLEPAEGDGAGEVYSLMLNWTAHRFQIPFKGGTLRPQFEPYLTLSLVDENARSVFADYNGGVGFRWVDFPWDKWVNTTFFMGLGLSYSTHVYTADRERHPDEERSHLKFDWPIQFTFALPRWPQHQLVIYNDHQSGGHIFDEGGVNCVGIGYRFEF